MTKTCLYCHQEKDTTAFRHHSRRCYACWNERARGYYKTRQPYLQAYHRAKMARRRKEQPERVKLKKAQWRQAHREEINARNRAKGPGLRAAQKAKNPEKVRIIGRAKAAIRRARLYHCSVNDLSHDQIQEILAAKGYRCDYCGKKRKNLTIDHITAIAKGGDNTLWNVTVACKTCNSSKGTGEPLKAVQPLLLTLALPRKRKVS